jgi:hypothetical protein
MRDGDDAESRCDKEVSRKAGADVGKRNCSKRLIIVYIYGCGVVCKLGMIYLEVSGKINEHPKKKSKKRKIMTSCDHENMGTTAARAITPAIPDAAHGEETIPVRRAKPELF